MSDMEYDDVKMDVDYETQKAMAKAVYVKEPRVDINKGIKVPVIAGSQITNQIALTSQSISNSQVSFTTQINDNVIVDRRMFLKTVMRVTITGTPSSGNVYKASYDAPRAFPYQRCCNTITVKLNGNSFTCSPIDYLTAINRYMSEDDYRTSFSTCACMPDQSQQYSDFASSLRNPLGSFLSNTYMIARGVTDSGVTAAGVSPVYYRVVSNNTTTAVIDITSIEPIMCSPLIWGKKDKPGFANLSTLELIFNTDFSKNLFWSHDNTSNPVTNWAATVSLTSSTLYYQQMTPNFASPIDQLGSYYYDFYNIQSYPTDLGSYASGAVFSQVQSQNLIPQNIPSRIFIYVRQRNADQNQATTDTFCNISNVKVNFNNQEFLSSSTSQTLYNMSVRNGLPDSYVAWQQYCGSVCCLEMGGDIGLEPDQSPGMASGVINFSVNVSGSNLSASTQNLVLYVVMVSPGVLCLKKGSCTQSVQVVTKEDILFAKSSPFLSFEDVVSEVYGGNLFSRLGHSLYKAAKMALPFARKILPAISKGLEFLPDKRAQALNKAVLASNALVQASNPNEAFRNLTKLGVEQGFGNGMQIGGLNLPPSGGLDLPDGGKMRVRRRKTKKSSKKKSKAKRSKSKRRKGGYIQESYDDVLERLT